MTAPAPAFAPLPATPGGVLVQQLFPPGQLWNFDSGQPLQRLATAIGDELDRVVARGADLMNEADPRTATETIADWEKALGLPDDRVLVIPSTLDKRRAAVVQKLLAQGGQNLAYFVALAAACGWVLTVSLWEPLRVGFRVGARCYSGDVYAYAVAFMLSSPSVSALSLADTQRILRAAVHAHITVIFT